MRMLAGWFLRAPAYETKYELAYHLLDHADHVTWLRQRLSEMRGGQIDASVAPALGDAIDETIHAPDVETFIAGAYLELEQSLLDCYRDHLASADPVANAAEIRLLRRMIPELERHITWATAKPCELARGVRDHRSRIALLIQNAGGISGLAAQEVQEVPPSAEHFERPRTVIFDHRITRGELMRYHDRKAADATTSAIEDFKVFFNELYAASLLASLIYDAEPTQVPWEFLHDVARHFWDEVRHSQFGAVRLKELGTEPTVCNPVLFERSQSLPILHRFCYLSMGLEPYFMPRKRPRVKKYDDLGDHRSQLFADQDWSDETLHVTFGKRWVNEFLKDDFRSIDDVLEEVRQHIEQVSGEPQEKIAAPF
jgi:hypothetical protein